MDFRAALDAIEGGSRVRREAWHNGRRWIARQEKDGFAEYVMALAPDDQTIEWPLAMGRADWCAPDWIIVDGAAAANNAEEHTSEHQSLMRISHAILRLKKTI